MGLLVWPDGFSIDHDPVHVTRLWALVPIVAGLAAWASRDRVLRWAAGWVALALLPRLVIVRQADFVKEYQVYLAMVGLSLGVARAILIGVPAVARRIEAVAGWWTSPSSQLCSPAAKEL